MYLRKSAILSLLTLLNFAAACQQPAVTNTAKSNQTVVSNANLATANKPADDSTDHSSMNHGSMNHASLESSPNAASAEFDVQFLDTMIVHHAGAIEMAEMVSGKTQNTELKKFAAKIIADQKREIAQMKAWREIWFAGKPEAVNMELPGMRNSMKMMTAEEMKKMEAATDKDFDRLFLQMMTPHHVGAVAMAKDALGRAEHPEIKTLSGQIIKSQEAEIKQMQNWQPQ